ncbi:MAG: hypothetical protein FWE41_09420, partial [Coriobacteriia bacterium]|nr:hypothetical protein [Coriobacteriia bacterium]MCL2750968.1 hypothetical protein [Coriobacteriia bacterium]
MSLHEKVFQDDRLIAYGFLLQEDQPSHALRSKYIQLFYTASDARKALACASPEIQAVVCERPEAALYEEIEISPLNLAAALAKDNPLRDIYLEKTNPQGLFVSRAEKAGARGVITIEDAQRLLGECGTEQGDGVGVVQRDGVGVPLFVPKSGTPTPSLCTTPTPSLCTTPT